MTTCAYRNISKLEEEPAKKEFEALSVRLEELQKEAQAFTGRNGTGGSPA